MATQITPATAAQIRGMIGVLDFYQWKGVNVIRMWPRKPKQPWTPAQLATVQALKIARASPAIKTPEAYHLSHTLPTRPLRTLSSYQTMIGLRSANAFGLFDPIYPYRIDPGIFHPDGTREMWLYYQYQNVTDPIRTQFYTIQEGDPPGPLVWHITTVQGTPGNGASTYYVMPQPLSARRITEAWRADDTGFVQLGLPAGSKPTTLLAYYVIAPDAQYLLWAMPMVAWQI